MLEVKRQRFLVSADPARETRNVRAFLAAPSLRLAGPADGVMSLPLRERIAALRVALLDSGVTVYSSHHDEEWVSREGTGPRVPSPFRAMQSADVVFAYVGQRPSTGMGMELGWATALRKPVVLMVDEAKVHGVLIDQLESVTKVLPIKDDGPMTPSALRHTVVTALDWADQAAPLAG
ncbi:nucleoside 2-deoxyribosyltransferase [Streptacidiphilus jiangxiensis]|uniref:Nucleoside 2-deoxyribosyltransferase n=2 Tax=Streptacidiphilus jiangxiensis TaxID=235985 RepID=A0A1H7JKK0_STRJI|nr:nucleoside 2-deoxyribosyltransferase [Streptacidiphilus jiangxiensis]SEK74886.1 Nucleoside 2-deoxyribosyltransferase [Streptacidiphilus jiangxiensis]